MTFFKEKKRNLQEEYVSFQFKGCFRFTWKYIGFKILIFLYLEASRGKGREREEKGKEEKLTYLRSQISKSSSVAMSALSLG